MGRGKHCSQEERELIKKLRNKGFTYKKISELLSCSQNKITNALKWTPEKENRGRRRKTTTNTDKSIKKFVKRNPFATSTEIKNELNLKIDTSTIRKRLLEDKMYARSPRKTPLLKPKHLTDRLQFAREHISWSVEKWSTILWTDESKFNLFGPDIDKQYVRRPPNTEYSPKYTTKTIKHGGGNIQVWGCFSWNGVGPLYWIKDVLTAKYYIEIMENIMLPYVEENMPPLWVFQQDNDPKHTSKVAKGWFDQNEISVMKWPAQSPDLNPIENLWFEVKRRINKRKIKNKQDLWKEVQQAWKSIPIETCRTLISSMPRRCQSVIKNNGYTTKY